jgi:hypothetical protein
MLILSVPSRQIPTLHQQLHRLRGILDVMMHLFPESAERFDHDEEILTLIFVARDLTQDMLDQCDKGTLLASLGDSPPQADTTEAV